MRGRIPVLSGGVFPFVLEELNGLETENGIITEGAAYMPELLNQCCKAKIRYLSLTPSREFQIRHFQKRTFVPKVLRGCSDLQKAFRNWMERDALLAMQVRRQREEYGYPSILNDGS